MDYLGLTVKDRITGFTGTVTGHVRYITGCNQCLVVPKVSKNGAVRDASWFDEQRLEIKGGKRLTLDNGATPGHDLAAPIR